RDLVLHALDLDAGDRAALQAGEQDPPQAVADGHAEAALERLGVELAVRVRQGAPVRHHAVGQLQATPANAHVFPLREIRIPNDEFLMTSVRSSLGIRHSSFPYRVATSMMSCSRMS